jgi:ferritin-like metal-binding protein YciE
MSQTASSILISSLRGAHAMETHALEILERQAARLERHPEFQSQIQHHLAETKRQIERLEECLDALGEDTCADKAPAAQAAVTGLSNAAPEEDILRN